MLGMLGFVQLLPERLEGAEVDACDTVIRKCVLEVRRTRGRDDNGPCNITVCHLNM
jgi:hypothetical protein